MTDFASRQGRGAGGTTGEAESAAVPGRTTQVQAAAAGIAGPGQPLPHLDRIQAAFSGHDLSGVQAHVDARAAAANAAMGSTAYTRGEHIAFATTPDLRTAAHEAAHVVQQRAGVNVAVGGGGDAHEQQARDAANAVVAGTLATRFIAAFTPTRPGGGGGTTGVQPQSRAGAGAGAGAGADAAGPAETAATGSVVASGGSGVASGGGGAGGLARVQAAIAGRDVAALADIQPELRRQLPAPEAVQALTAARHWEMERVVEIRERYRARLETARQGASAASADSTASAGEHRRGSQRSGDHTSAVHGVELEMDAECKPYLDALQHGDPQRRFEHTNATVEAEVFAAIRLHGTRRGEDMIGHRADAEAEARRMEHLDATDEWCGAFAYAQMHEGASFDSVWAVHMGGTTGILQALRYGGMHNFWLWVDGQWRNMVEYHAARNSPRRYVELTGGRLPTDVQPGDILLVDHHADGTANHIQTVLSCDGENVITIGGNEGQGEAGVHRSRGRSLRDNPPIGSNQDRIHGIGRWSIVDYERHIYFGQGGTPARSATIPTAPPSQASSRGRR